MGSAHVKSITFNLRIFPYELGIVYIMCFIHLCMSAFSMSVHFIFFLVRITL